MKRTIIYILVAALWVFTTITPAQAGSKDKDPVQARKELTAMGLSYNNTSQFLAAVRNKDAIAIELFIAGKGVDIDATDPQNRQTALSVAYKTKNSELVKTLLQAGATPGEQDVMAVVDQGDRSTLLEFTKAPHFNRSIITEKVLDKACSKEKKELLITLVEQMDEPVANKAITPMVLFSSIATFEDLALTETLLKKLGKNVKNVLNDPRITTIWDGSVEYRSRRLLAVASDWQRPDFDIISLLVKYGADVNAIDPRMKDSRMSDGSARIIKLPQTPLFAAVSYVNPDGVAALLKHGGDPNIIVVRESGLFGTNKRETALSNAQNIKDKDPKVMQRAEEIIRLLKEAGAKTPDELKASDKAKNAS